MSSAKNILFLCLFLLLSLQGFAVDTLLIRPSSQEYYIKGSYLEILEDPHKDLSIRDVVSPLTSSKFFVYREPDKYPFIVNTGSAYWIRFKIKADSISGRRWVLENLDPHIDQFELYKPSGKNYFKKEEAGYALPFGIRNYPHKNFIFDLDVDTTVQTYYIRVASRNHNPFILKVRSSGFFTFYALNEYYLLGMFYGIMAIMAIYNFLLFLSFRDNVYIYYVIYVLCCALISLAEDGLGFQYIWPDHPDIGRWISMLQPLILMITFSIYSKKFLELRQNLPKLNRFLDIIIVACVVLFILDIFLLHMHWDFPLYFIPFLIIYIASIICLRKGFRSARYYLLGYSFMLFSIILLIFRMSGVIHWDDIFTVYSFNIGLVFEIVILSIALSDRIKIIRSEKENADKQIIEQLIENEKLKDVANKRLEEKVAERTVQLKEKNDELEEAYQQLSMQSEEIQRMNLLLNEDNTKLEKNVKELSKARVMLKEVDFTEFGKIFPDKESCLKYLSELKWKNGYTCKKCGNTKSCQGKEVFSRRCTKCRYDESATSYTIFHRLKFPITKAFYMVFLVYSNKGKITSFELSQILSLRQSTCWTFSKKVVEAMKEKKKQGADYEHADGWALLVLDHDQQDE
ncbi:MAG: 7TM diverse intracellular signaling domain-containing protein [Cytophagaceae bacterium]